jgi:radical SAM modification target selenobiotic family peptide
MDGNDLKKILAGFCVAGLITGSAAVFTGCSPGKSA